MKWDDEEDPSDLDDDDFSAFETLRKVALMSLAASSPLTFFQDLKLSMDAVFTIDQDLVTNAVRTMSLQTLSAYRSGMSLNWNDAELAVYLVYIFGEIVKSTGQITVITQALSHDSILQLEGRAVRPFASLLSCQKRNAAKSIILNIR